MIWKKSESGIRPEEVDTTSSKTSVLLRKNITETSRMNEESGDETVFYKYEEAILSKEEYADYLKGLALIDLAQQRADIDYLFLMTGISLEEV